MITREDLLIDISPELSAEFGVFRAERLRTVAFTYAPQSVDMIQAAFHKFCRERGNVEPPTGTQFPRMLDAAGYLPMAYTAKSGHTFFAVRGLALVKGGAE